MANLNPPQFERLEDESLTLLDIEVEETTTRDAIVKSVDELLAHTAGHQIVSASEMADRLLDLRILVSKLPNQ